MTTAWISTLSGERLDAEIDRRVMCPIGPKSYAHIPQTQYSRSRANAALAVEKVLLKTPTAPGILAASKAFGRALVEELRNSDSSYCFMDDRLAVALAPILAKPEEICRAVLRVVAESEVHP